MRGMDGGGVLGYGHVIENPIYTADHHLGDILCEDQGQEPRSCSDGAATASSGCAGTAQACILSSPWVAAYYAYGRWLLSVSDLV